MLVPLVFLRNLLLGAFGLGEDKVAPAVIEVSRLSDGEVVGRISASSSYYEQADLLAAVRQELETQTPLDFLRKWNID